MPPLITQFWVVSQEGICDFHRNIAESIEDKDNQNNSSWRLFFSYFELCPAIDFIKH